MRLRRLDLARYGKFTDLTIDFGEPVDGEPDLHIVYGPNEAGKSTAFAGFLDLLFGIELQSRYGFLHPYAMMRVDGCLELSVGVRELVRIKRPLPTLYSDASVSIASRSCFRVTSAALSCWSSPPRAFGLVKPSVSNRKSSSVLLKSESPALAENSSWPSSPLLARMLLPPASSVSSSSENIVR